MLLAEGALVSETVAERFVCMAADTSAGGGWLDIVEWNRRIFVVPVVQNNVQWMFSSAASQNRRVKVT